MHEARLSDNAGTPALYRDRTHQIEKDVNARSKIVG